MLRLKRGRAPECKDVAQNFAVDLSIRPANLSITHNFGRIEPKLDIGETGEPTPHDPITRWRVTAASKVAPKPGQFGDIERQRPLYGAIPMAIRNKMIKQLALGF